MAQATNALPLKRLGEYLPCSPGRLHGALQRQAKMLQQGQTPLPIGQLLLRSGAISDVELRDALEQQRIARLANCPVFTMLKTTELSAIGRRFKEISVPPGRQFITQDERDPTLYILAAGRIEVYRTALDGAHLHLAFVEPAEPIGEMGYFQGGIRTASVRAVDRSQLLVADYDSLTHYFEHVPRVAFAFTRIVEQRRRATEEVVQAQSQ